jgi:hypothetical protein
VGRILAAAVILISCTFAEQPVRWGSGKVIKVERRGTTYDYSIFNNGCGYVGRSKKKLRLEIGDEVKYSISGEHLELVDGTGKVQHTQCRLQWLAPPPPPMPKQ